MYAIYHEPADLAPYVLRRYDPSTATPGDELLRAFRVEELREFLAANCTARLQCEAPEPHVPCEEPSPPVCHGRDRSDPRNLVEVWSRADR